MPRWFFQSKPVADSCCKLSIFYLKKLGMFDGQGSKVIQWTSEWTERTTTVHVRVIMEERPYMRLRYLATDSDGNSTEYDYRFYLNSTPCQFGGVRWWFACRDYGRRVAILYLNLKRCFYRGRPTKRYRRILAQLDKLEGRCSCAGSFLTGQ